MNLFSVKGKTTVDMAMYFLGQDLGLRILSIQEFSDKYEVGRGTVQDVINDLIESGIISIEKRGRLGTTLITKDNSRLLSLMGKNHLLGTMPLPYTRRYEGLATGVIASFKRALLMQVSMSYMKNADSRVSLLLEDRVDFAVISEYHALSVISDNPELLVLATLGDYSYLSKHVIIKNSGVVNVVGVDANSYSHRYLIERNFDGVELVQVEYSNLKSALEKKIIDATVMNYDDVDLSFDFSETEQIIEMTRACILINKKHEFLINIVGVDSLVASISSLQKSVMQSHVESSF